MTQEAIMQTNPERLLYKNIGENARAALSQAGGASE